MKIHRGLIWVEADPELLDRLASDRGLQRLLLHRPAPNLCAVRREDLTKLQERLEKLGLPPEEIGGYR